MVQVIVFFILPMEEIQRREDQMIDIFSKNEDFPNSRKIVSDDDYNYDDNFNDKLFL